MNGGAGNDAYVIDSLSDLIQGEDTQGDIGDRVFASVSGYTLGAGLEALTLTITAFDWHWQFVEQLHGRQPRQQ